MILPPGKEEGFKDHLGNLPYDLEPYLGELEKYIVVQNQGDAIFVPSGWHHQVWNVVGTIYSHIGVV